MVVECRPSRVAAGESKPLAAVARPCGRGVRVRDHELLANRRRAWLPCPGSVAKGVDEGEMVLAATVLPSRSLLADHTIQAALSLAHPAVIG